ncbi:MAG: hypothetical protein ABIN89_28310, partial [Chitinophagaceae bacterium]
METFFILSFQLQNKYLKEPFLSIGLKMRLLKLHVFSSGLRNLPLPDEINPGRLQQILENNSIEVSCISTGQLYADGGLMLTQEDPSKRKEIISIFKDLIDLAENFGRQINIGRV